MWADESVLVRWKCIVACYLPRLLIKKCPRGKSAEFASLRSSYPSQSIADLLAHPWWPRGVRAEGAGYVAELAKSFGSSRG